jgi:hypothetical protein
LEREIAKERFRERKMFGERERERAASERGPPPPPRGAIVVSRRALNRRVETRPSD